MTFEVVVIVVIVGICLSAASMHVIVFFNFSSIFQGSADSICPYVRTPVYQMLHSFKNT